MGPRVELPGAAGSSAYSRWRGWAGSARPRSRCGPRTWSPASFPGGQLFIDLQGYTPSIGPVAPEGTRCGSLLFALGVAREQIPEGLAERAALYRGQLAETRTLVILDNAASLAQVEPLLPGTAGCLVLVTSGRALSGLDSQVLALDTLPPDEAAALFRAAARAWPPRRRQPARGGDRRALRLPALAIRVLAARLGPAPGADHRRRAG